MRIEQLTFTRFIAAFAIVIFHFGRDVYPFNYSFLQPTVLSLNIGVSYFFILSGFVITIAYSNKENINTRNFYLLRLARIFPAFLISFFFSIFYLKYIGEEIDLINFFTQLFLIHDWFIRYYHTLNQPSWSLCVELLFYLFYPLIYNNLYNKSKYVFTSIIIFWIISQSLYFYILSMDEIYIKLKNFSSFFPLMHLNQFLSGNLLALYLLKNNFPKRNNLSLLALTFCVLLLIINAPIPQIIFHNGLLAPVFCFLIFLFSTDNSKLSTIFQYPFFVLLGEISFGIYIYQYPVYKLGNFLFFNVLKLPIETWTFYVNFIILIVCSFISFKFIEKPIIDMLKNSFSKPIKINS